MIDVRISSRCLFCDVTKGMHDNDDKRSALIAVFANGLACRDDAIIETCAECALGLRRAVEAINEGEGSTPPPSSRTLHS